MHCSRFQRQKNVTDTSAESPPKLELVRLAVLVEIAQSLHVGKILSGILTPHLFLGVVMDNGIELLGVLVHVGHKLLEHLHLGISENTMCVLKKDRTRIRT